MVKKHAYLLLPLALGLYIGSGNHYILGYLMALAAPLYAYVLTTIARDFEWNILSGIWLLRSSIALSLGVALSLLAGMF